MLKMMWLIFNLLFLLSLGVSGEGQESAQLINLYDNVSEALEESAHSGTPIALSVNAGAISEVSKSVLMAETWLRTHVLAHYPATPITTIVVGSTILCLKLQDHNLGLVLPALKNIHHSLTRWGLEKDIKVSAAFSSGCFNHNSGFYRENVVEKFVRPLIEFLQGTNSTYSVNPPPKFSPLPDETMKLVSSHSEFLKKLGFWGLNKINVINPRERKPLSRKLSVSFMDSRPVDPFPARPNPLPKISDPPLHSSVGFSVPANVAKNPHPPQPQVASPPLQLPFQKPQIASPPPPPQMPAPQAQIASPPPLKMPSPQPQIASSPQMPAPQAQTASPPPPTQMPSPQAQTASPPPPTHTAPPTSFSPAPENPPFADQSPPPSPFTLPPCHPIREAPAPAPVNGGVVHNKLWCVAKPTVPADTLQVAMDYACGDGGADCKEIMPDGNCYNPDSVVAHASYAFNSYWQKNKRTGGTCSFDGTAMLINNDPSYLQCHFVLT